MPLTAHLPGHGTLDATLDNLGSALPWEAVYRARPRPALACSQCGLPMHAKVSPRGGRFFAHDRRSPTCTSGGETEEHRSLKRALAAAAREAGHRAELEVAAPHGGWRADVLVTAPGGRATALEAQLSSVSVDEVLERTRRYDADGIDVVWFTHRATRWLDRVPAARLHRPATADGPWIPIHPLVSSLSVVSCAEVCAPQPFWHNDEHAGWIDDEERTLAEFVADVLHGRLVPLVMTALRTRSDGWTTPEDVRAAADYDARQAAAATPPPSPAYVPAPDARWYQRHPPVEQQRLLKEAKKWVKRTTGTWPIARPQWEGDWVADGLALSTSGGWISGVARVALIRPEPGRVDWSLLGKLPVIVGSKAEHDALKTTAPDSARIVIL